MKIFAQTLPALFIGLITLFFVQRVSGQSILNPTDSVYTYNSAAAAGTPTNPNQPAGGVIGKWVRTVRLSWNSNEWKCYIYNGMCFRLHFPKGYNPTANDGKVYPLLVFYHGAGEAGLITDNEESMAHGGQSPFQSASDAGTWPGYILIPQNTNGAWDPTAIVRVKQILDYMITNNKLDAFHITDNGLSAGGGGAWNMILTYPYVVCAHIPMSSNDQTNSSPANLALTKFTPIWDLQGGLDTWPDPGDGAIIDQEEIAAGADYTYKLYSTLGHDTWDSTWVEPNFWPFLNNAYSSNPWALHGQTAFCPGVIFSDTLGIAPGYDAYQWRQNGVVMPGSTSNSIVVTTLGTYDARVQRNGIWSDWSHTPAVVSIRQPTVTPPITTSGLESVVIPSLASSGVTLQVPAGYATYTWQQVGNSTTISSTNTLKVTSPGQYIVEVTQTGGCSSSFSPPFTVESASGPNAPSPASGVLASALSQTSVLLTWSQNPTPVHNETGFEIYQGLKSGGPYTLVAITAQDASHDTITGLTSATKYYYVIRAVDSTGASTTSNEASVLTIADTQPPTAPGALTVTGTSFNSVSLSWTASTDNVGVVAYDIYVNGAKAYSVPPTQLAFTVYSLVNGQNYVFILKARDAAGNVSSPSNQATGQALLNGISYNYYNGLSASLTAVPNYATLTPAFSGTLPNFSLSPQQDNTQFGFLFQGYIIIPTTGVYTFQTSSDDGSNLYLGKLGSLGSPYNFSGTALVNNDGLHGTQNANSAPITLQAGIYPIAVAYLQEGGGFALTVNWKTPGSNSFVAIPNSAFIQTPVVVGQAPAFPTNLATTALSYKSIGLTWTDNSNNETGFEIYRSTSPTGTFSIVTTTPANTTAFTDSTCQASTTYYYRVQAINQYGPSGFDPTTVGGVSYSYYGNFTANNLSTLPALTPTFTGNLTNISLSPATSTVDFAFKFLGYITIPATGSYTFYTTSDDGSDLYVGGFDSTHLVVKNDFLQAPTQRSGTVSLTAGRYPLYVTYFQQGGGFALTASYKGPGIAQTVIPDSAFYAGPNTHATTLALPAVPAAPTSLVVTATSAKTIGLSWTDNGTTANNYQVYRSNNNNQAFILVATLPSNAVSYKDSGLFANATYYYEVNAVNVGGVSAFTNQGSAVTPDIPPVMTAIASQQARYGTTTTIPVSATGGSGAITLTAPNLPTSFAVLTDNGNGRGTITLNPTVGNAGTYTGLTVVATDAFGGSSQTQFNLSINNNFAPTINPISNYSMNEGDSLTIPLAGQDVNGSDTLTYSVANVPANYGSRDSITQNVSGTGSLFIKAGYAAAGTYAVVVTLNDKNGLSATQTFTLTVVYKNPNQTIYTRIQAASALGAPWNNMTSPSISNLVDINGVTTNVGINLGTTFWDPQPLGPSTGNNTGVYPDAVLSQFWYFGLYGGPANPVMTISGLNPSLKYNVTLFAASVFSGVPNNGTTTYSSGSQTVSLNVQGNTANTVTLDTLTPASGGTIAVTMGTLSPGAYPGYLNAVVLQSAVSDGTSPAPPNSLQGTSGGSGVALSWTDVAYNANSYKVYRAVQNTSAFTLLATLPSTATSYVDSTVSGNTQYYYTVDATNGVGASPFSDTASVMTADKVPVINAIANVTVNNTQSVQVNVTAIDDPTNHLTLTASGLPSFASFVDNGNGTGVITITPTAGLQGSFDGVTVTATDMVDSSRSTSFNINVVDTSIDYTYLSFTNNPGMNPAPWNGLLIPYIPFAGFYANNLLDQAGNNTGVTVTLTDAWDGLAPVGEKRRNGSDLYPESVSDNAMYTQNNNNHRITVTGLNPLKAYNFQFYSSFYTSQNTLTHFTIDGQTISLSGSHNSNKTAQINGVTPDNTGTVVINCVKDTAAYAGILNALVIESYTPGSDTPRSPADLRKLDYAVTGTVSLQWQDRASNETGYEVWRAPDGGAYAKLATLPANSTTYVDANLPANTTYDYIVRAVNGTIYSAYSSPLRGYTYESTVFVFLNRIWPSTQPHSEAPPPFNNLNWNYPSTPNVWYNFTDETGLPTNVGLSQPDPFDEVECCGAGTGNNSGVFPDAAMNQDWLNFIGDSSYAIFTGLDASKTYDFTLFGSVTDDNTGNGSSKYYINGQSGILNAHLNTSGTITFFGIKPDGNGNVSIGMTAYDSSNSSFGTLGVVVIKGYTPSTNTVSPPPGVTETATTAEVGAAAMLTPTRDSVGDKPLMAYPNPFDRIFNLSVPASNNDNVLVSITDVSGHLLYAQRFGGLVQGDNVLMIQTREALPSGMYIVNVLYVNENQRKVIKMIRK